MFAKTLASTAIAIAFLAAPAANAACLYNNSSVYAELKWTSQTSGHPILVASAAAGQQGCGSFVQGLGTMEVFANGQAFCPLPFSTDQTSVTIVDDASKPHKLHCKRDVGAGWKGD